MKTKKRKHRTRLVPLLAVAVVLIALYVYIALSFPLPNLKPTSYGLKLADTSTAKLSWPTIGESAVGVNGTNIIDTNGTQKAVPTASIAKLMTALSVLKAKPLQIGQPGPTITLGPSDVTSYNAYLAQDGSIIPVVSGEQMSEYQMLEAMLLPSADNIADSLAIWAFDSLPDYSTFANNYAQQLGLSSTHIGSDASGLSPDTTSTPTDMVKLGEIAMNNPVIAQIVGLKTASGLPVVSSVKNVNQLLGVDNIIGIKTGNSDQAGGVFVSASTTSVGGRQVTVVTALANAPTLYDAMYDSLPLIKSAQANFLDVPAVIQDNVVGSYILPWGGSVAILAKNNLSTETWQGTDLKINVNLNKVSTKAIANQQVGTITVQQTPFSTSQTSPAILQKAIPKPPIWWRILHPKGFLSSDSGLAGFKL